MHTRSLLATIAKVVVSEAGWSEMQNLHYKGGYYQVGDGIRIIAGDFQCKTYLHLGIILN